MAKQIINIGQPDKGNGDPIRTAFDKVNQNFTELYNNLGGGGNIDLSAVDQHIIPATDSTYDLGTSQKQWRSLYVSTNTIYIDNTPITVSNNTLVVGDINNQVTLATLDDVANIPKGDTGPAGPQGDPGADALWDFQGNYDNGVIYTEGAVVVYNGESWYRNAVSNSVVGYPPGGATFNGDPPYWVKIAAKGDTGAQGPAGTGLVGWAVDINNHFVPNTNNLQDIGTPTNRVRHIYVGPGSITVGNSVITESATGKLVVPGVTRGVNYTIDEVEEKGDQNYTFSSIPVIIDAAHFDILQQVLAAPQGYVAPEYSVNQLDDGEIDGITVTNNGAGLDQSVASKMRDFMRAYVGSEQDPIANFGSTNLTDWIQIPFTVSTEAADVEYENGGADLGDFSIDGSELSAEQMTIKTDDGDLIIQSDSDVVIRASGTNKQWQFNTSGNLELPEGGDILNSSGQSVLGGGSNSYTPEDPDLWDSPAVNTVQAALDELAAKVAALQNLEIDGGNANTPAAGELLIDGNGA